MVLHGYRHFVAFRERFLAHRSELTIPDCVRFAASLPPGLLDPLPQELRALEASLSPTCNLVISEHAQRASGGEGRPSPFSVSVPLDIFVRLAVMAVSASLQCTAHANPSLTLTIKNQP